MTGGLATFVCCVDGSTSSSSCCKGECGCDGGSVAVCRWARKPGHHVMCADNPAQLMNHLEHRGQSLKSMVKLDEENNVECGWR